MLRKLYLVVPVLALLALPSLSHAQFEAGNWALQLSGSGSNDKDFETGSAGIQFDLGYFLTKELEGGVRQGFTWADGGSTWNANTNVYVDYHFDLDRWQPYVGGFIGYIYGDNVDDAWVAGPEAGVKYFVNATTFINGFMQYNFDLNNGLDSGSFVYGLGIGFKW
jgi:hypothetical protein